MYDVRFIRSAPRRQDFVHRVHFIPLHSARNYVANVLILYFFLILDLTQVCYSMHQALSMTLQKALPRMYTVSLYLELQTFQLYTISVAYGVEEKKKKTKNKSLNWLIVNTLKKTLHLNMILKKKTMKTPPSSQKHVLNIPRGRARLFFSLSPPAK